MSTHNICFRGEIRKMLFFVGWVGVPSYLELCIRTELYKYSVFQVKEA